MKRFHNLSIRQKLILLTMTIAAAALLPAAASIAMINYHLDRQTTSREVTVLAEAVAFISSAALAFDNQDEATLALNAFRAEPRIIKAALFDLERQTFAVFDPVREFDRPFPHDLPEGIAVFDWNELQYLVRVREDDTDLGWLLIVYDLKPLHRHLLIFLALIALTTAASLIIAYILSFTFQGRISGPVLALEKVARRVSSEGNYNIRATKQSDDEIGLLTDAFNEMLKQISFRGEALRISEERLRTAVESSPTGVWDWDLATQKSTWVGSLYESLGLGKAATDTPPDRFFAVVHPEDRPFLNENIKKAMQTRGTYAADFRAIAPDGSTIHIRARGQALDGDGPPNRLVGIIIDVTDLRTAQEEVANVNRNLERLVEERTAELRDALEELESFNYSVSHDLHTPLRSISGFSKVLLEDYHDKLDTEGRNFLERIVGTCEKMGRFIDDMLKLSRITQREIRKERVDLSSLAMVKLESLGENEPMRMVETVIQPGMVVDADPRLLSVALDNLLDNAWKFTSKRKIAKIEVGNMKHDGEEVFFVKDNGAGFDPGLKSKLFGVFQRLHSNVDFAGTGIGLSTVRRIVERHGGKIWADGIIGEGATFYFTLPKPGGGETQPGSADANASPRD